jgi:hypothetical protein
VLRCYNKYLEFDRSSIESSDYQRIKLQELEDSGNIMDESSSEDPYDSILGPEGGAGKSVSSAATTSTAPSSTSSSSRTARTVDVELRGAHLLDLCAAGDVVICTGELKMMQVSSIARIYDLSLVHNRYNKP